MLLEASTISQPALKRLERKEWGAAVRRLTLIESDKKSGTKINVYLGGLGANVSLFRSRLFMYFLEGFWMLYGKINQKISLIVSHYLENITI